MVGARSIGTRSGALCSPRILHSPTETGSRQAPSCLGNYNPRRTGPVVATTASIHYQAHPDFGKTASKSRPCAQWTNVSQFPVCVVPRLPDIIVNTDLGHSSSPLRRRTPAVGKSVERRYIAMTLPAVPSQKTMHVGILGAGPSGREGFNSHSGERQRNLSS